ncbi:phosphoenolpyruvate synthase [Segetibacter koreensis]|uniref:phosphoenolpyruvate synthase n=1 Tax=Segetibacter koreensis TaxID=398037 RepID=UPI00035F853E|nr:phosphoenolpyruvate synthase [Segetibacter koreensis]
MIPVIKTFSEISINDIALVGGKNASLGEMYSNLSSKGVHIPDGFAITAEAYRIFLNENNIQSPLSKIFEKLDTRNFSNLAETGKAARQLILENPLPHKLVVAIKNAHYQLCGEDENISVAVRSSATAEDLPSASFAGQLESFLNIRGEDALVNAVHKCFTSLFTDRAIYYRHENGFGNVDIAISVGVQKMVRSDLSSSGVAFTLDPDTGFDNVVVINSIYGLGENIVQGQSTPDEFILFKPHIDTAFNPIINKKIGGKEWTMIYPSDSSNYNKPVVNIATADDKRKSFSVNENDVKKLASWCVTIEKHYDKPMDIEWAKDGITGELFIVQARPETVQAKNKNQVFINNYVILKKGRKLTEGIALGEKISAGKARIIKSPKDADLLQQGEVLVTDITTPDWDPIMKKAGAIITNKGGRTSHAAIVARELGTVAVVGCGNATEVIKDGQEITVSCAEGVTGFIYDGKAEWTVSKESISYETMPDASPMFILGDPSQAFHLSFLPNKGVGLLRMEFLIMHDIKIHPLALTRFEQINDEKVKGEISELTFGYSNKKEYFIEKLAQGVATIAAAFYPKDVIVRMSDFKTNEYSNLIGGKQFEPAEENPMLGFRGASRYYNPMYKDGFELECAAMKKVREEMGFTNVKLMIPFCRTVDEGKKVIAVMEGFGLKQRANDLEIYMMVEIPSNVLLADQFAKVFDGFSIGSNDLTQLTLGLDRDSNLVRDIFSEKDPAVKQLISKAIKSARNNKIKIGLCGQAPSDMPDFAEFLIEEGINSISFNPDALLTGIDNMLKAEDKINRKRKEEPLLQPVGLHA